MQFSFVLHKSQHNVAFVIEEIRNLSLLTFLVQLHLQYIVKNERKFT